MVKRKKAHKKTKKLSLKFLAIAFIVGFIVVSAVLYFALPRGNATGKAFTVSTTTTTTSTSPTLSQAYPVGSTVYRTGTSCTSDSDGGNKILTKGYVSVPATLLKSSRTIADGCWSSSQISEMVCDNGEVVQVVQNCNTQSLLSLATVSMVCYDTDGNNPIWSSDVAAVCGIPCGTMVDTDGGFNVKVSGMMMSDSTAVATPIAKDSCVDGTHIKEYSCENGLLRATTALCAVGTTEGLYCFDPNGSGDNVAAKCV